MGILCPHCSESLKVIRQPLREIHSFSDVMPDRYECPNRCTLRDFEPSRRVSDQPQMPTASRGPATALVYKNEKVL